MRMGNSLERIIHERMKRWLLLLLLRMIVVRRMIILLLRMKSLRRRRVMRVLVVHHFGLCPLACLCWWDGTRRQDRAKVLNSP